MKKLIIFIISVVFVLGLVGGYFFFFKPEIFSLTSSRTARVLDYLRNPDEYANWKIDAGEHCGTAPFAWPTSGYIGYLWDDSFRPGHRHSGLDIFGGEEPGLTPIVAAYDGYLTRLDDWKSTVIIRIPQDPLNPQRQIWNYYTHMADVNGNPFVSEEFPPGTYEVFVKAGTVLGYQGNYSGTPGNPTGVHLHFSIVKDDGQGNFLNETDINNTLDPSPYFGIQLNAKEAPDGVLLCSDN